MKIDNSKVASEMIRYEEEIQGRGKGNEKREAVIRSILEMLRPSYHGNKLPMFIWKPITWFLAEKISDAIECVLTTWRNRFGKAWPLIRRDKLIRAVEIADGVVKG